MCLWCLQSASASASASAVELQRQQEARRRAQAKRRAQLQSRGSYHHQLRTPDPVEGRQHVDVQTELYLEELRSLYILLPIIAILLAPLTKSQPLNAS